MRGFFYGKNPNRTYPPAPVVADAGRRPKAAGICRSQYHGRLPLGSLHFIWWGLFLWNKLGHPLSKTPDAFLHWHPPQTANTSFFGDCHRDFPDPQAIGNALKAFAFALKGSASIFKVVQDWAVVERYSEMGLKVLKSLSGPGEIYIVKECYSAQCVSLHPIGFGGIWNGDGDSMEYLGSIYGVSMEYLWSIYGVSMEYLWSMYG